ncbi:MAG TPA: hypothetical protein VM734_12250 [Kofleriaceae bacterium]|nr:hypothetical protein [Kofleriaceae bacterium]
MPRWVHDAQASVSETLPRVVPGEHEIGSQRAGSPRHSIHCALTESVSPPSSQWSNPGACGGRRRYRISNAG